jgi:hypothetical protein
VKQDTDSRTSADEHGTGEGLADAGKAGIRAFL